MIFAKLDVCMWRHKKFRRAGPAASGYWAAALACLRENESTTGLLEADDLGPILDVGEREARKLCERLVECELFAREGDGYVLLNYAKKNETKEEIEVRRAETAERVANLRKRRRAEQNGPRVYFVELPSNGAIKIGWSNNVIDRVANLSGEMKQKLRLLATINGGEDVEKGLHAKFSHLKIAGEWFEPAEELLDYIASITSSNGRSRDSSNAPSNSVTRIENGGRVPGSDSPSVSDLRSGEGVQGENQSPPTRRPPDPFGDESIASAWADGVREGTGKPITKPTSRSEVAKLVAAVDAHAPPAARLAGKLGVRVTWLRDAGARWGRTNPAKVNVWAFVDWLDAGAGGASGETRDDGPKYQELGAPRRREHVATSVAAVVGDGIGRGGA